MQEDLLVQQLREAIRKRALMDPDERFQDMVRRGIIDEKGNVLKRMPEPPWEKEEDEAEGDEPDEGES